MWRLLVLGLIAVLPVSSASAAFPGRNGRLAVVLRGEERGSGVALRVVTARSDGTDVRPVGPSASAHWSPDGRSLLVGRACPSACSMRVIKDGTAGTVRLRARPGTAQPLNPAWTPAGRFVFGRQTIGEAAGTVIVVADRRGRERVLALPVPAFAASARAAPRGGAIAVAVWSPDARLVIVAPGGAVRVLIDCAPPLERQLCTGMANLDWSPDASRIAFEVSPAGGPSMIRIVDVSTGGVSEVRPGTAPFWSPDGSVLGSVSPQRRIELGPPGPGPTRTLRLRDVWSADWQPRAHR